MRIAFCLMAWIACVAYAAPEVFLLASAGEAPYQSANDLMESTILPQAGIGIAFTHPIVTPYSETTVGFYNQRLMAEQFFGLQIGKAFGFAKPTFTFGLGLQTAVRRDYGWNSDEFERKRLWIVPFGFGGRLDLWNLAYAEWEARGNGYPMWKLELGFRVF